MTFNVEFNCICGISTVQVFIESDISQNCKKNQKPAVRNRDTFLGNNVYKYVYLCLVIRDTDSLKITLTRSKREDQRLQYATTASQLQFLDTTIGPEVSAEAQTSSFFS